MIVAPNPLPILPATERSGRNKPATDHDRQLLSETRFAGIMERHAVPQMPAPAGSAKRLPADKPDGAMTVRTSAAGSESQRVATLPAVAIVVPAQVANEAELATDQNRAKVQVQSVGPIGAAPLAAAVRFIDGSLFGKASAMQTASTSTGLPQLATDGTPDGALPAGNSGAAASAPSVTGQGIASGLSLALSYDAGLSEAALVATDAVASDAWAHGSPIGGEPQVGAAPVIAEIPVEGFARQGDATFQIADVEIGSGGAAKGDLARSAPAASPSDVQVTIGDAVDGAGLDVTVRIGALGESEEAQAVISLATVARAGGGLAKLRLNGVDHISAGGMA